MSLLSSCDDVVGVLVSPLHLLYPFLSFCFFDYLHQQLQRQLLGVSVPYLSDFSEYGVGGHMALVGKYSIVMLAVTLEAIDSLHNYTGQLHRKQ